MTDMTDEFNKIMLAEKESSANLCLDKSLANTRVWIENHQGFNECQGPSLAHLIDVMLAEDPPHRPLVAMFATALLRLIEAEDK